MQLTCSNPRNGLGAVRPPYQVFVLAQDRAPDSTSEPVCEVVALLEGRNPCEDCVLLTDRTVSRLFFSASLMGTPPPLPRGAEVSFPLPINFSSFNEMEVKVADNLDPAADNRPDDPPLPLE